ncbi:MAG: 23S rRNA (pseudouridine(1915)-N(3))-methyltransferase RlmH [Bacilli bacterium]
MIKIIALGKLKEKYLIELNEDYLKRINKYHPIELIELKESTLKEEAINIKKHLNTKDYIISLAVEGNTISSLEFSKIIDNLLISGRSNIVFIIGSSDGLDKEIKSSSDYLLSFSSMTLPHGLFRVFLTEQIYRAFKIINNERYHK